MLVSDSSPLIAFARAKKFDLLQRVLGSLVIPQAVYDEAVRKGKGKPGAIEVQSAPWIRVEPVKERRKLKALPDSLGKGEKEAIILAEELGATLLLDDPVARREAKRRGLLLFSSLDILQEAKDRGIISEVKKHLDELRAAGFYLSSRLYREALRRAGEEAS